MTLIKIYQLLDQPNSNGVVHPKELHREFMKTQIGKEFPITLRTSAHNPTIADLDEWVDPCIVGEATITSLDDDGIPLVSVDLTGTLIDLLLDGTYVLTSQKMAKINATKRQPNGRVSVIGSYQGITSFDITLRAACTPTESWKLSLTDQVEDLHAKPPSVKDRLTNEVSELTTLRASLAKFLADNTKAVEIAGEQQVELMKHQLDVMNDYITTLWSRINLL